MWLKTINVFSMMNCRHVDVRYSYVGLLFYYLSAEELTLTLTSAVSLELVSITTLSI